MYEGYRVNSTPRFRSSTLSIYFGFIIQQEIRWKRNTLAMLIVFASKCWPARPLWLAQRFACRPTFNLWSLRLGVLLSVGNGLQTLIIFEVIPMAPMKLFSWGTRGSAALRSTLPTAVTLLSSFQAPHNSSQVIVAPSLFHPLYKLIFNSLTSKHEGKEIYCGSAQRARSFAVT